MPSTHPALRSGNDTFLLVAPPGDTRTLWRHEFIQHGVITGKEEVDELVIIMFADIHGGNQIHVLKRMILVLVPGHMAHHSHLQGCWLTVFIPLQADEGLFSRSLLSRCAAAFAGNAQLQSGQQPRRRQKECGQPSHRVPSLNAFICSGLPVSQAPACRQAPESPPRRLRICR